MAPAMDMTGMVTSSPSAFPVQSLHTLMWHLRQWWRRLEGGNNELH